MQQLLNTLYITIPNAYVHLENSTICVQVDGEKKLQVPLHHLQSVVCFGDVMLSAAIMQRCAEDGISLVLLSRYGEYKARLEGITTGNILLRQAHHQKSQNHEFTLSIAKAFIVGKLRNARQIILRGAREAKDDETANKLKLVAGLLLQSIRQLKIIESLDAARGIEGDAAKNYFAAINFIIRKEYSVEFAMTARSRRPPLDKINALLSFLYTLLMHDCRSALEAVGLDPQLGFLHAVRPGRSALALDLMEEFRAPLVDRLALTLINRGQITAKDFMPRPGGVVFLNDEGRKTVLVAYQKRKQEGITHSLTKSQMALGLVPMLQARLIARAIRGDIPGYLPFLTR